jgi:hypothetical protein
MEGLNYVALTAAVVLGYFALRVATRTFDPFAPIWLFLVGYTQLYIIQAWSFHEWAVRVRGEELVTTANARAFWALLWLLAAYHSGLGRLIAWLLPAPPTAWSDAPVAVLSPILFVWGLFCAGMVLNSGDTSAPISAEVSLLRSFHCVLLVSAVLMIVTARNGPKPRPALLAAGIAVGMFYVLIWMFHAKRSHSLMGVLCTTCAFYITKHRRPSWPVLAGVAFTGALVVAIAIGWRSNSAQEKSFAGFFRFVSEFRPATILENLSVYDDEDMEVAGKFTTHETEEYGGYLLMLDAVPNKSEYDYGMNYLRVFSTFIPRVIWPDKPLFGREQWVKAWVASSEMPRDMTFTGPAIGLLGAAQLNGGARGTLIVLGVLGVMLGAADNYFRRYQTVPWVQAWWATTFINAWFLVVTDDPMVWFYYNWGFTTMPVLIVLWVANALAPPVGAAAHGVSAGGWASAKRLETQ